MRCIFTICLVVLSVSAFAADFFDDFESYTIGDSLGDYADWIGPGGFSDFYIADDSGDNIIDADFTGGDPSIAYFYIPPGIVTDVGINLSFEFNGYGSNINLARYIETRNNYAYSARITFNSASSTTYHIFVEDDSSVIELQTGDVTPPVQPDVWTDFEFVIVGDDPVHLEVFVNGSSVGSYDDSTYLVQNGSIALIVDYDTSEPMIHIDDFGVTDTPIGIESASLGEIKAAFK